MNPARSRDGDQKKHSTHLEPYSLDRMDLMKETKSERLYTELLQAHQDSKKGR